MLKVITWNCNMAFRKKAKFIETYKPDILIVPECEHPDKLIKELHYVQPNEVFWYGNNLNKGLGIFSFTNYKVKLSDCHDDTFRMILPLEISNDIDKYSVFAIWANNPQDRDFQYIGQVWKALIHYQQKIEMTKSMFKN